MNNSGLQDKNHVYQNVNKVQDQGIFEWILNLTDIVVYVVVALYSRIEKWKFFFDSQAPAQTAHVFINFLIRKPLENIRTPRKHQSAGDDQLVEHWNYFHTMNEWMKFGESLEVCIPDGSNPLSRFLSRLGISLIRINRNQRHSYLFLIFA
jgi:hypothetical protein